MKKLIFSLLVILSFNPIINNYKNKKVPYDTCIKWDWSKIDTGIKNLWFPKNFLFGVATSAYQVEGNCTNNQWSLFECKEINRKGKTIIKMPQLCGLACDHYNRYKEDVQLIKKVHSNAYRFSVEWSKVEPEKGFFDEEVLDHYEDVCLELIKNGIAPCINIHHYTEPIWFFEKGGFEKKKNIKYYVRFAKKIFERLHDKVHLWFTFNSPVGHAMPGFFNADKPPYKSDMKLAVKVLRNLLESHVQVYQALKAMPGGKKAKIGILHNVYQLDPIHKWNPIEKLYAYVGNQIAHTATYNFFTKGIFKIKIPFKVNIKYTNKKAPKSLDFIGINYYSHAGINWTKRQHYPGEIKTLNKKYTIYPEGLYRAIHEVSDQVAKKLNIPMYVTENGNPQKNEGDRDIFLKRYMYAMSQAIQEGCDVRGYFYWSLMDNYEWGKYFKRYGLYHVDFETQVRTLKPSAKHFIDVAKYFTNLEHNQYSALF